MIRKTGVFILVATLLASGLVLVAVKSRLKGPGRLVASESEVVWRSPPLRDGISGLRAEVDVPLLNPGDGRVRVTSVESGCGCTRPSVTPSTIEPGESAVLSLVGTPLSSGERTVTITVHTDSAVKPDVVVRLKMISDRQAPFVHGISGDFAYTDDASLDETREVSVMTVEAAKRGGTPAVHTDLPFLAIAAPTVEESSYDEALLIQRKYTYKVRVRERPEGSFTGRIWVEDPWSGGRPQEILAMRRVTPRIRVIPGTLSLDVVGEGPARGELRVLSTAAEPGLSVGPVEGDAAGVLVEEVGERDSSRRLRTFSIQFRPAAGTKAVEARALVVRASAEDRGGIVVPVVIRRAGR